MSAEPHRFFSIPNFSGMDFGVVIDRQPVNQLALEDGIFAIIACFLGLLSILLGLRFFRITFFFTGLYFGYIISFPLISKTGLTDPIAIFSVAVSIGILLGAAVTFLWKTGLFVVGCLAGWTFSTYALGFLKQTVVAQPPWSYVFAGCCCLAFGCLIFFLKKPILVVSTSMFGAYFIFYGIDVFLNGQTGFAATFDGILSGSQQPSQLSSQTWMMASGSLGLGLIGVLLQLLGTGKKTRLPDQTEQGEVASKRRWSKRKSVMSDLELRILPAGYPPSSS